MDCIKNFIKEFDIFGVGISFNYKSEETYKSLLGGIFSIIFIIVCILFLIPSFIEFIRNRPVSVIYYTKELEKTDSFSFQQYKIGLAFILESDSKDLGDIQENIQLDMYHVSNKKNETGQKNKIKTPVVLHKCKYEDFYDLLNDSMDRNQIINNYYCPELDKSISGIYTDELFEYYQIDLKIKNVTDSNLVKEIIHYSETDFKLFYTDTAIDVTNHTNPVNIYSNEQYIPLSPIENKKVDLFFNIKEFESTDSFILDFPKQKEYGSFLRSDVYSVSKGEDRYETKVDDYNIYAKIYIRAASSRIIMNRRYQKLTELVADVSSLPSYLIIILSFLAEHFNSIFIVESVIETIYRTKHKDSFDNKKFKEILFEKMSDEEIRKIKNIGNINIDNIEKYIEQKITKTESFSERTDSCKEDKELKIKKTNFNEVKKCNNLNNFPFSKNSSVSSSTRNKIPVITRTKNKRTSLIDIVTINNQNVKMINERDIYKDKMVSKKVPKIGKIKKNLIVNDINDIFCCCCKKKSEDSKLLENIKKNFYEQLDVFNYLKFLQAIKLLSYVTLNKGENYMLRFLTKPTIFFNEQNDIFNLITNKNKENIEKKESNENIENKEDIENDFWNKFQELLNKNEKTESEEKLCELVCLDINNIID